jgi:hypothetical protein
MANPRPLRTCVGSPTSAAEVVDAETAEGQRGISRLVAKYEQYQADPPRGPVIVVRVERWTTWSWTGSSALLSHERQKGGGSGDDAPRRAGRRGTL